MHTTTSPLATLVLGASTNPDRTSYTAIHMLRGAGLPVLALGLRAGRVADVDIQKERDHIKAGMVDTVTLYLGAKNQVAYYDWILELKPKRVIFNPGAENPELAARLSAAGISYLNACTLVLIRTGQYV